MEFLGLVLNFVKFKVEVGGGIVPISDLKKKPNNKNVII